MKQVCCFLTSLGIFAQNCLVRAKVLQQSLEELLIICRKYPAKKHNYLQKSNCCDSVIECQEVHKACKLDKFLVLLIDLLIPSIVEFLDAAIT